MSEEIMTKIAGYEDQIGKLQRTIEELNRKNKEFMSRSTQYESRISVLNQEISKSNKEKIDKIQNLDETLRKKQY